MCLCVAKALCVCFQACELELWNVVNEELQSISYKPIAFTADHASLSSGKVQHPDKKSKLIREDPP